jgi:hypothetical protein
MNVRIVLWGIELPHAAPIRVLNDQKTPVTLDLLQEAARQLSNNKGERLRGAPLTIFVGLWPVEILSKLPGLTGLVARV